MNLLVSVYILLHSGKLILKTVGVCMNFAHRGSTEQF